MMKFPINMENHKNSTVPKRQPVMEFPSEFRYIYAPFCGDDPSSWLRSS